MTKSASAINSILHLLPVYGDPQGLFLYLDGESYSEKKVKYLICTDYVDVNIQDFCKIKIVLMEKF